MINVIKNHKKELLQFLNYIFNPNNNDLNNLQPVFNSIFNSLRDDDKDIIKNTLNGNIKTVGSNIYLEEECTKIIEKILFYGLKNNLFNKSIWAYGSIDPKESLIKKIQVDIDNTTINNLTNESIKKLKKLSLEKCFGKSFCNIKENTYTCLRNYHLIDTHCWDSLQYSLKNYIRNLTRLLILLNIDNWKLIIDNIDNVYIQYLAGEIWAAESRKNNYSFSINEIEPENSNKIIAMSIYQTFLTVNILLQEKDCLEKSIETIYWQSNIRDNQLEYINSLLESILNKLNSFPEKEKFYWIGQLLAESEYILHNSNFSIKENFIKKCENYLLASFQDCTELHQSFESLKKGWGTSPRTTKISHLMGFIKIEEKESAVFLASKILDDYKDKLVNEETFYFIDKHDTDYANTVVSSLVFLRKESDFEPFNWFKETISNYPKSIWDYEENSDLFNKAKKNILHLVIVISNVFELVEDKKSINQCLLEFLNLYFSYVKLLTLINGIYNSSDNLFINSFVNVLKASKAYPDSYTELNKQVIYLANQAEPFLQIIKYFIKEFKSLSDTTDLVDYIKKHFDKHYIYFNEHKLIIWFYYWKDLNDDIRAIKILDYLNLEDYKFKNRPMLIDIIKILVRKITDQRNSGSFSLEDSKLMDLLDQTYNTLFKNYHSEEKEEIDKLIADLPCIR